MGVLIAQLKDCAMCIFARLSGDVIHLALQENSEYKLNHNKVLNCRYDNLGKTSTPIHLCYIQQVVVCMETIRL